MIAAIFEAVGEGITGFAGALSSAFTSVTGMILDTSGTTPVLTVLGTLVIIPCSIGIVYLAVRFIQSLLHRAG